MRNHTEQNHKESILRVLVYIQNHLDDDMSLEQLASVAHFAPCHFHRVFRRVTGEPVMEHVRRLRLERAAYRLKITSMSVTNIALAAGYETPESFTRAFGESFGISPFRYRTDGCPLSFLPGSSTDHIAPMEHFPDFEIPATIISDLEVAITSFDPAKVAFVRSVGPYGSGWLAWRKLLAWAREHELLKKGTRLIGIRHDCTNVTPPDKCRYDACITVDERFVPKGDVGIQEIGGGKHAVVSHHGYYGTRFGIYAQLCNQWAPVNRRKLRAAPVFEVYRKDIKLPSPWNIITTIHFPLET